MTDTQPMAPTDAEIVAFAVENGMRVRTGSGAVKFARAVLAKWGTQPVVPVWIPASAPPKEEDGEVLVRMADGRCEIAWATYWHGSSNAFAQWTFRDPDEDEQPVEWMHISKHCATTPQPTQAQAVAVPLTDREIELIDGMIQVQLDHAGRCDAIANRSMADKQKGWDMERVALLQKFKAHGTKGGQHGTEY